MSDAHELHRRACAAFAEIVDLPSVERSVRLEALVGTDDELRRELLALLAADASGGGTAQRLQAAIDDATATFVSAPASFDGSDDPLVGEVIGGYRVTRLLAVGGMGRVYEARQEAPERLVALKLLDSRALSRSALSRFRHEAAVMARLAHPNIAQIYEAGTQRELRDGSPWFAMELVPNALTIVQFAHARGLRVRERVELFLPVCDAVHFGHERGVLHRDLKPSNVLIDTAAARPQPKIIDFGIARSIDSDVTLATLRTEVGQIVGTLQYMSPEQCAGDPGAIGVRSDVYSLGLLLHELVTGRPVFDISGLPVPEAMRVLAVTDPPRLRVAAPNLSAEIDADLETIVAKTIAKDPARRYATVAELAADLRRHLKSEPITARPTSAVYAVRLFARRHRALVAGMATTIVALVLGIVGTSIGLLRSQRAESRAQTAREEAEFDAYVANVTAAEAALRTRDVHLARQRLDAASPAHRGWEWRHLRARLDRSLASREFDGRARWSLAYTPDGANLVLIDGGGRVRLLDATTLEERWSLQGPAGEPNNIAFAPNGERMAVAFDYLGVVVIDLARREIVARLAEKRAMQVAFATDARGLIIAGRAGLLERWDMVGERAVPLCADGDARLGAPEAMPAALAPDGSCILVQGAGARLLRLADCAAERVLEPAELERARLWMHASFAPDASAIAYVLDGRLTVRRLDKTSLALGAAQCLWLGKVDASSIAWSADASAVLVGDGKGTITMYDATTLDPRHELLGHEYPVIGLAATTRGPDGPRIASIDQHGALRTWSPLTHDVRRYDVSRAWVYDVDFAPTGEWFATAQGERPAGEPMTMAMSTATGRRIWASPPGIGPSLTYEVAVTEDGTQVMYLAGNAGELRVLDAKSGAVVRAFPQLAGTGAFGKILFRPHHAEFVETRNDVAALRSFDDGSILRTFAVPQINERAVSPDGDLLALSPRPGTGIQVVSLVDGAERARLTTDDSVWSMTFSGDGRRLAARCEDGRILLWSTSDWTLERTWAADGAWGDWIAFEPSDRPNARLVGRVLRGVRVWDPDRGRELVTCAIPAEPTHGIAFSRDGTWLGFGCVDGSVLLFDAPLPPPPEN